MLVSDYIASFLKKRGVKDIFMLTGYGAMYLNDSIKKYRINYYATRNEATAPIMAEAYARIKKRIGVVCVTAGPGATNAIPGLAEAFVDSAPILVISGQVDYIHTTHSTGLKNIRSFGTAEINIIPIVKPLTKYCSIITDPKKIRYELEKCFHIALSGRPGPVWLDIPLNIQREKINLRSLKKFKRNKIKSDNSPQIKKKIYQVIKFLKKYRKPIFVVGNGVKISNTFNLINKISEKLSIPIIFTRASQDLASHDKKNIFGQAGIKGTKYCKFIMNNSDLVINFGSRLAPQFIGHKFEAFQNAKVVSIDIENDELKKRGAKSNLKINADLKIFIPLFSKFLKKNKINAFDTWLDKCTEYKKKNTFENFYNNEKYLDLYYFMKKLDDFVPMNSILVTDSVLNYYIGGQVWKFKKKQKEISSVTNAAMGLSIPLAIGASVAEKKKIINAVTGDGSLELNIQELKTISHYNLNINVFVINNGGYVSMHNWTDVHFKGRRVDSKELTGEGTFNFKKVADAFDLDYFLIKNFNDVQNKLKNIVTRKGPKFIEVVTNPYQKIFDAFKDV